LKRKGTPKTRKGQNWPFSCRVSGRNQLTGIHGSDGTGIKPPDRRFWREPPGRPPCGTDFSNLGLRLGLTGQFLNVLAQRFHLLEQLLDVIPVGTPTAAGRAPPGPETPPPACSRSRSPCPEFLDLALHGLDAIDHPSGIILGGFPHPQIHCLTFLDQGFKELATLLLSSGERAQPRQPDWRAKSRTLWVS